MKPMLSYLLLMAMSASISYAADRSLVPATPSTVPDYFCTWNVQGYACNYTNASDQADQMVEANLFGTGPHQDWLGFYPRIRADLTFLLDDAFDFPLKGGHNHPRRGSIELDAGRFPSYTGTPAERLARLSRDVQAKGWRDLGLWICNSRPNMEELPIDSETYWCERLAWSQAAGIGQWKVDWGIGVPGKPLWKFRITPKYRAAAPDIWLESGSEGDLYRTYDVQLGRSIPETIRRIAAYLAKPDPKDRRIINCEDEVFIGAGLGCAYGVMRHPLAGNMPNGKPDSFFGSGFRDIKRQIDEVTRAVRWHRIAQPFPKGDAFLIDGTTLSDVGGQPAPARIARGGLPLPVVTMPDGAKEPPYALCARHPDGAIAIATIPRAMKGERRKQECVLPLADVALDVGPLDRPVGIFGRYASLTLKSTSELSGRRILAQDLAGDTPVDITAEVRIAGGTLTIPGSVLQRIGLMAASAGDVSDPGLVLVVDGLAVSVPRKPMKPGMFKGPVAAGDQPAVDKPAAKPATKLTIGTPARLRLTADRTSVPSDGSEIRIAVEVLDAAGTAIGNEVKGRIAITTGKGLFPTGQTFDFRTVNGQDAIEFRSYDAGPVTLTATSDRMKAGTLIVTVVPASKP